MQAKFLPTQRVIKFRADRHCAIDSDRIIHEAYGLADNLG